MSIYGIGNSPISTYDRYSTTSGKKVKSEDVKNKDTSADEELGVVYEPSKEATEAMDSSKTANTDYSSIISKLKSDADAYTKQLQNLVSKLFTDQANYQNAPLEDLKSAFEAIKNGEVEVDPETVAQAKKDIAEDGEWGIEKTSERMFNMAKALSGGDTAKADKMIAAVKKGFDQASEAWGGDLPEISQKTLDATIEKLEKWRDGLNDEQ